MSLFETSPESGSRLLVLMACGFLAGEDGVCQASVREIARLARIEERQCQRVLTQLAGTGTLLCEPTGGGRGRPNRYRFTHWPGGKGDVHDTLSEPEKGVTHDTLSESEKGVTHDTFSQKGVAGDTLSEPKRVSPMTGFSEKGDIHDTLSESKGVTGDTLFPALARTRVEDSSSRRSLKKRERGERDLSSSSSKSLSGLSASQEPVARFLAVTRETGLPDPEMSRIGTWIKTLRDSGKFEDPAGALIELFEDQIGRGLGEGEIEKPWSYFHRCVGTLAKKKLVGRGLFPKALEAGGGGGRAGQAAHLEAVARRRAGVRP